MSDQEREALNKKIDAEVAILADYTKFLRTNLYRYFNVS